MEETALAAENCVPCRGGVPRAGREEITALAALLPAWTVLGDPDRIERRFAFPDFASALAFANAVGEISERAGHHPDLVVGWGRVVVTWYTHAIGGLHRNDFVMAARTDQLHRAVAAP